MWHWTIGFVKARKKCWETLLEKVQKLASQVAAKSISKRVCKCQSMNQTMMTYCLWVRQRSWASARQTQLWHGNRRVATQLTIVVNGNTCLFLHIRVSELLSCQHAQYYISNLNNFRSLHQWIDILLSSAILTRYFLIIH